MVISVRSVGSRKKTSTRKFVLHTTTSSYKNKANIKKGLRHVKYLFFIGSESNIFRSNKLFRKLNSTILWIRLNIARVEVNSKYNQTLFNTWDIIHTHEHKLYYDWLEITSSASWGPRRYVFELHKITSNFWWCHYGKSKKNWSRMKTKYSQSWSFHQEIKCPVKYFGIAWFSVQVPAHKIGTKFGSLMLPRWICHRVGTARSKSNWICIFMIFWDFKTFYGLISFQSAQNMLSRQIESAALIETLIQQVLSSSKTSN